MASPTNPLLCLMSFLALFFISLMEGAKAGSLEDLVYCLGQSGVKNVTNSGFEDLLNFSIQNLRFTEANVSKPSVIIVPQSKQEVQKAVICCKRHGFQIRLRCGGHSYEGTSSTAEAPFAIIDLMKLNQVQVDVASETAWVQGGATLGEVYYAISQASPSHGFSAGTCPTVGSGGHISGGGFGLISRKYGLAADNVVDAELVNANGDLLNRKSMGEDVFWAIRGGGGGSWGAVVAWKIKLLPVPPTTTVFTVYRAGIETVTNLVYQWQTVAPNLDTNFYLSVFVGANLSGAPNQGISAKFLGMFLGPKQDMLNAITSKFPGLGIKPQDCQEVTWIQSILYFSGIETSKIHDKENLRDRYLSDKNYFFAKSDYVRNIIPRSGILGACRILEQEPKGYIIMDPYGGKMAEIRADSLPFPHRTGNLYDIQYLVAWYDGTSNKEKYLSWLRKFYAYMTPYVSQNPRAAYVNYMDFDLGTANHLLNGSSPVETASQWGKRYFLDNFERLVQIKTHIDPDNVFQNPQSIPPNVASEFVDSL
ncbi:berberine bridge enzyme-like D-2 [Cryptomeria japonica]|uniref:berberine bridge enzyme-like D-2 n=1 Tax=Cryptomeria japonica TaxID=3369 RepID=UPI0027DAABBA|nr:berberine bridge enzyme-like D-2 [Cryptomeria japonica]